MRTKKCHLWIGLLGLLAVAPLYAQNVVDRAKFFSADAVKQAEGAMKELEREHNVSIRVETFETVPGDQAEKVKAMSSKERGAFFANWLKELARDRKAKGVFVLICREPSHLRVGVSKELHQRGFTDADRDAASDKLMARFKAKEYDRGLQDVVGTIRATADRKLAASIAPAATRRAAPAAAEPPAFASWSGWLCLGIGGLVAIVAIFSVVSALFRNTSHAPAPGGYGGVPGGGYSGSGGGFGGGWGGGGLMGGLLSGLGGSLLGNWMYDRWSGGRSAHAGEPHDAGWSGPTTGGAADDNYQDFGSSGGDFGDSSGGDFGGVSDFGGGGSDFGGGGDSGGGGGDF